jgi:amino-acid N-acetyltransferase
MIRIDRTTDLSVPGVRGIVHDAGLPLDGLGDVATDLFIAFDGEDLVGVAALELHGPHALLRSVAVVSNRRGEGIGSLLVDAAEAYAAETGIDGIYLLTDTAAAFFAERGYQVIARDAGPAPVMSSVEWAVACGDTAVPMVLR